MTQPFLSQGGGYRKLLAFKLSEYVCDLTVIFIQRFIRKGSRTNDQMEQTARSCKQNIVEGSKASRTSRETEIKLTNVARSSLEELLEDYQDYLRQHNLSLWDKEHPRTLKLRDYIKSEEFKNNPTALANKLPAEEYCNMLITLIHQTNYLLDRLLIAQQKQFLEQGGIREQMTRARIDYRNQQQSSNNPYRKNQTD